MMAKSIPIVSLPWSLRDALSKSHLNLSLERTLWSPKKLLSERTTIMPVEERLGDALDLQFLGLQLLLSHQAALHLG